MELGGKDAAIVCADADIEAAAKHIVKGAFSYSGQRCTGARHCCRWALLGAAAVALAGVCACSLHWAVLGGNGWSVTGSLPTPPHPTPQTPPFLCSAATPAPAAVKVVLVEEGVADRLVSLVVEGVQKMSVGM